MKPVNELDWNDIIAIDPELFGLDPNEFEKLRGNDDYYPFSFRVGKGWYDIVESLVTLVKGYKQKWVEKNKTRQRVFENEKPDWPDWVVGYFEKYPVNPMENFKIIQIKEKIWWS